jgi:hypothetical protein
MVSTGKKTHIKTGGHLYFFCVLKVQGCDNHNPTKKNVALLYNQTSGQVFTWPEKSSM